MEPKCKHQVNVTVQVEIDEWPDEELSNDEILSAAIDEIWTFTSVINAEVVTSVDS